jgi:nicotinamidase-related amidase
LHEAVNDAMLKTNMLANSKTLMNSMRDAGCTIIHCPINFEPGHNEISANSYGILANVKDGKAFTNGSWGAEFCQDMAPQAGDLIVKGKSGLCGFQSTNLEFLLTQRGCKNVVLGGFLTNCCVESTMRTAYEKGFRVFTLSDCVAATSMEAQEATIKHNFGMFSIVTTSQDVAAAMTMVTT